MSCQVSVILPVYNSVNLISRCLESLLNQTLTKLEIICVLDCPTDGTDAIIKKYRDRDKRIKLIENKKNLGVAESRNLGIANATGKYIGFSDHDDWCENEMYETLYEKAINENLDIVFSDCYVEKDGITEYCSYKDPGRKAIIESVFLPMFTHRSKNFLAKSVWASIYRRELVLSSGAEFGSRNLFWEEDSLFNLTMFSNTDKIGYCKTAFYHWNNKRPPLEMNYVNTVNPGTLLYSFNILSEQLDMLPIFSVKEKTGLKKLFISVSFYFYYYHYRRFIASEIRKHLGRNIRYLSLWHTEARIFSCMRKNKKINCLLKFLKFTVFVFKIRTASK